MGVAFTGACAVAGRQRESEAHADQKNSHMENPLWVLKARVVQSCPPEAELSHFKIGSKDIAGPAKFHLFMPALLDASLADGAVDEPAKGAGLELPGRALPFSVRWTLLDGPALLLGCSPSPQFAGQVEDLPFGMGGDLSPSLLITVDGLYRGPQQLGHLVLGFVQSFSKGQKFFAFQKETPFPCCSSKA